MSDLVAPCADVIGSPYLGDGDRDSGESVYRVSPGRSPLRIHVNQHIIRQRGTDPLTVRRGQKRYYGNDVVIHGPSRVVYSEKPLDCGARVWLETWSDVEVRSNRSA
jgi:hypothetical protein